MGTLQYLLIVPLIAQAVYSEAVMFTYLSRACIGFIVLSVV